MPRSLQTIGAYSFFGAAHTAAEMFESDKYLEWVLVTPRWTPNEGKILIHRTNWLVLVNKYPDLETAKQVLTYRADTYNAYMED